MLAVPPLQKQGFVQPALLQIFLVWMGLDNLMFPLNIAKEAKFAELTYVGTSSRKPSSCSPSTESGSVWCQPWERALLADALWGDSAMLGTVSPSQCCS